MIYTLVFLACLMSVVVWWLIKQTVNLEPWVADAGGQVRDEGVRSPITTAPLPSAKLALGVFLAVATSLFALFISAYSIRMEYFDWRPLAEPGLLWVNTAVLILSSVFLQWAWKAADRGSIATVKLAITLGGGCALAFVGGQLFVWNQLSANGFLINGNPANAFFYLLTGVHGLHLLGGLVALSRSVPRVWGSEPDIGLMQLGLELCAVYWHYLLVVWLMLFGLMLVT